MRLLSHKVNMYEGYANDAAYQLTCADVPAMNDMRFDVVTVGDTELFFAEKDGYVRFFAYSGPSNGFGGSIITLTMTDGSVRELVGPWSSRSGVMNRYFPKSVEVVINGMSGAVTVEWLVSQGINVAQRPNDREEVYIPANPDGTFAKAPWRPAKVAPVVTG